MTKSLIYLENINLLWIQTIRHHLGVLPGILWALVAGRGGLTLAQCHLSPVQCAALRTPKRGAPEQGIPATSYLPDLVRTIMAPLQHLNEASTAPTAAASVGSLVMGARRRSSSNNCKW